MTRSLQSQLQERAAASSGQMQKPGRSNLSQKGIIVDDDEILTNPVKITPEENDPFLYALNELSHKEKGKPIQKTEHLQQPVSVSLPMLDEKVSETDTVENPIGDVFSILPWHQQVPTWFWVLFTISATSSIVLAAVLAAILVGRL